MKSDLHQAIFTEDCGVHNNPNSRENHSLYTLSLSPSADFPVTAVWGEKGQISDHNELFFECAPWLCATS